MRKKMRRWVVGVLGVIIVGIPIALIELRVPSEHAIREAGSMKAGSLDTASNMPIDIHIIIGDVFNPKRSRGDVGFDLVGVSCFFDPIRVAARDVLPGNPLLFSAIRNSARSQGELEHLISNLVVALESSRAVVSSLAFGDSQAAEGDQITPYVWVTPADGFLRTSQGVKYLAAMPMFDPAIVTNEGVPPGEAKDPWGQSAFSQ